VNGIQKASSFSAGALMVWLLQCDQAKRRECTPEQLC
jgi:hypothetical protein